MMKDRDLVRRLRFEMDEASMLAEETRRTSRIISDTRRTVQVRDWKNETKIVTITRAMGTDPIMLGNGVAYIPDDGYKHLLLSPIKDNQKFLTDGIVNCMGLAAIIREEEGDQELLFGHIYGKEAFSKAVSLVEYFGNRQYQFDEIAISPLYAPRMQTPQLEKVRRLLSGITDEYTELIREEINFSTMYANKEGVILGNNTKHIWKKWDKVN